jgi:hypothetical protein
MGREKIKTQYPGVRYYEHATRKMRNGQPDRYFSIRYRQEGRLVEETLGWATDGWNAEKAHGVLAKVREGKKTGIGAGSVAEMRAEGEARRKAAAEAARHDALVDMTVEAFFKDYYMPRAKKEKRSWLMDEQRIAKHINPAIGAMPFRAVTKGDVQKLIDSLVEGGSAASTVKQYMAIIRRAYYMASETSKASLFLTAQIRPRVRACPKFLMRGSVFLRPMKWKSSSPEPRNAALLTCTMPLCCR